MQAVTLTDGAGNNCRLHGRAQRVLLLIVLACAALLAGCAARKTPAPVTDLSSGKPAKSAQVAEPRRRTPPAGAGHTVVAGDTLFSIARRYDTSVESLAQLNQITDPTQLRVGQVLQLGGKPAVSSNANVNASAVTQPVVPPGGAKPAAPAASTSTNSAPPASVPASTARTAAPRASDAQLVKWDWPAGGRILQAFNINTKGIDLEGKIGDPVKAAADGTVMYAGNGVRGLGNLILLGHSDGFISAYAHNQALLVKTGEQIKQGVQIATLGQSDTTSPRLHFEIRRRGTPVNPLSYLPAR